MGFFSECNLCLTCRKLTRLSGPRGQSILIHFLDFQHLSLTHVSHLKYWGGWIRIRGFKLISVVPWRFLQAFFREYLMGSEGGRKFKLSAECQSILFTYTFYCTPRMVSLE